MKSGHLARGRAWLAQLAWMTCCAAICVTSVHAQSPVVCAGLDDAELLARIRGQTRDLPVVLIPAPSARVTRPSTSELQTIARNYNAEFVVSVDHEASGARVVYVLDTRAAELRIRTAPAPDRKHRFARSTAAETVALIVRGELSDALAARASEAARTASTITPSSEPQSARAGPANAAAREPNKDNATSASTRPKARPESKPQAASEPGEAEPKPDEHEHEHEPEDGGGHSDWIETSQLSLELAGRGSTVVSGRYFLGAALSLRWSFNALSIAVTGSTSLPDRAQIQGLALTLREHGIGAEALVHLPLPAALQLGLGAAGRWLFYQRSARSGEPAWRPEPANTISTLALGPQLELRWQIVQHLGVGVRIGLDVLLRPVSWRYRLDTNPRVPIELERQNRVEPWLSLGVFGSM